MYKLVRLNVERVVDNDHVRDKLIKEGYKLVVPEELAKEKEKVLEDSKNLEELTVDQLKELAKEKGLEGISKLKKEELINALKGDE